ncbi:MAG: SMC-Scp complex subunit ScpB [Planctomyces sp.]|jgi:segregation and condensation protein B
MSDEEPEADPDEIDSFQDIELAYRQALDALDEAERQVGSAMVDFVETRSSAADEDHDVSGVSVGEQLAAELSESQGAPDASAGVLVEGSRRVTPKQVIEAAIFVGGDVALTARRLATLVGQDVDPRVPVQIIDSLNQTYVRENRPYEIRLLEGGYRLELREEFQETQRRTFGLGPREVRLLPDALEVLAFVAYNQPMVRDELAQIDRPNSVALLRQLVRLQLVEIQRTGTGRDDLVYVTTDRFLKLFGLKSLSDLPTADIFSFK